MSQGDLIIMRHKILSAVLIAVLAAALPAAASNLWIHVRVDEGGKGEQVSINLPVSLLESLAPVVKSKAGRSSGLRFDDDEVSISDLRRPSAARKSSSAFSGVRYGARKQIPVTWSRPSATASKMAGNLRAVLAARMRANAASSESRSSPTQNSCMDEYPSGT